MRGRDTKVIYSASAHFAKQIIPYIVVITLKENEIPKRRYGTIEMLLIYRFGWNAKVSSATIPDCEHSINDGQHAIALISGALISPL
jgi:hypothetical protein